MCGATVNATDGMCIEPDSDFFSFYAQCCEHAVMQVDLACDLKFENDVLRQRLQQTEDQLASANTEIASLAEDKRKLAKERDDLQATFAAAGTPVVHLPIELQVVESENQVCTHDFIADKLHPQVHRHCPWAHL